MTPKKLVDYYTVLGVSASATLIEIRKAYRHLAFLHHPDITKNPDSVEFMQLVNEAYFVLSNPVKRAQYDFWRQYHAQTFTNCGKTKHRTPSVALTQLGTYHTAQEPNSVLGAFEKISLFIGQIVYRLFYDFLMMMLFLVLFLIPAILYFLLLGMLIARIAPNTILSSDDALAVTLISTTILTFTTIRILRKNAVLSKYFRMLKL